MSLLIDSDVVTQADLLALDPDLNGIASACNVSITGDNGILRKSWNQSANALTKEFGIFGVDSIAWPGTLTMWGAFGTNRDRIMMNQVVIAQPYERYSGPLREWLIYRALELFYQTCVAHSDKDRYQRKWEFAQGWTKESFRVLWGKGMPYVAIPLECPGSLHSLGAGDWPTTASWSLISGGSFASDTAIDVALTWVDQPGGYLNPLSKNNCESGPSQPLAVTVTAGNQLQLNIDGLKPPIAVGDPAIPRGIADGLYMSRGASGWNVYAGLALGSRMYLQNATPISVNTPTYTLSSLLTSGSLLLPGQVPDQNANFIKLLQRG